MNSKETLRERIEREIDRCFSTLDSLPDSLVDLFETEKREFLKSCVPERKVGYEISDNQERKDE